VLLMLAADILGGGKTSRLHQRLVYDLELATSATAGLQEQELMSFYSVTVDPKKEVDPAKAEAEMEKVIAEFLAKGPSTAELNRSKTAIEAGVLRGLEKVGGFGGKAVTLAEGALYASDPGFVVKQLEWLKAATPAEVLAAARDVMNAGSYQLTVLPYPEYSTTAPAVDRKTGLPTPTSSPDLNFPVVEEATLKNGVKVVLARQATVPIVNVSMQFDAGYASDSVGAKLGAASFAGSMLDEGTKRRTALKIAEELEGLGATLNVGSNLDMTGVTLSALKSNLQPSLDLMADVIRNPAFDQTEMDKLKARWIAGIEQEKANPVQLALRLLPPEMYGDGHAYGVPFTGSGTIDSITSLTRADLVEFHQTWLRPDNATIFVTGDATMAEIRPALDRAFGDWRVSSAGAPKKNIASVEAPAKGRVIIVDKPGSPQSLILAGHVAPPTGAVNNIALLAMNDILGGQFTARINMNLREDKGWAYGAYTFFQDARGQRPYLVYAPVQTDKTKESIAELLKEIKSFKTTRPATAAELKRTVDNNTRSLPGSYETSGDVLGSLTSSLRFGRPWNYPATLKADYEALDLGDISAAAAEAVRPDSLIWVIVGDRAKIEAGVASLGLGPIEVKSMSDL
jgi:zinc protease